MMKSIKREAGKKSTLSEEIAKGRMQKRTKQIKMMNGTEKNLK